MVNVVQSKRSGSSRSEKEFLTNQAMQRMRRQSEEEKVASKARERNIPYVDLNIVPINSDFVRIIPEAVARGNNVGIFYRKGRAIYGALTDPDNEAGKSAVQNIADDQGWSIRWHIVSRSSMERLLERYESLSIFDGLDRMKLELSDDDFESLQKKFASILDLKKNVLDMPTSEVLALVIAGAISLRGSDVHFEPQEEGVRLRYRIDGVLQDVGSLPFESYKYILSRVKMLGKMKLNVRNSAQDGHFSMTTSTSKESVEGVAGSEEGVQEKKIDIRVSILPGRFGETVVMRLLDQSDVTLGMETLGMSGRAYEQYLEELKKTTGMIITTGPTGSGKTTFLYSSIAHINKPGIKIVTIEDPVEYELKGASQTNVSKENGYTFSSGLRSIVRQDPDIILVGEIRDEETAGIAVQSALTGHLVFTTLHTNSAAGAVPRLITLGVKPSLVSSAANAFVAQRLVRKLCLSCREAYEPAGKTVEMLSRILALISPKANIHIPKDISILYRSKGCVECNYTGFKGRVGIFEVMFMSEGIAELIEDYANESDLITAAIEEGMVTMTQDGILKAIEGVTSMDEVWRVAGQFQFLENVYEKLMTKHLGRSLYIPYTLLETIRDEAPTIQDFRTYIKTVGVEDILPAICGYGLELGAEDVHIEPEEDAIHVRFRIDGVLQSIARMPNVRYPTFLGKIKMLSGLKTEQQVGLQDSRFTLQWEPNAKGETTPVDVRVSIILGGYGETVVMRLLNIAAQAQKLSALGMREEVVESIQNAIKIPNGIILTTGPTGSGKSTTLYSILRDLNTMDRKIMTVEDPIEYRMDGVLQTQVDEEKGYTFSSALRVLLRQNPDILMIGEVRDEETANMAFQASLTGHLVFSTIHTNDATSAVQRLVSLGVSRENLASAVNIIMAQRLVRILCECKRLRKATEEEQAIMWSQYESYAHIASGVNIPDFSEIYEPVGCKKCRGLGYEGMMVISEVINIKDVDVRDTLLRGASENEIRETAIRRGMIPMAVDGIDKVLEGATTLDEVKRVTEM